jgi:hypothetical protein
VHAAHAPASSLHSKVAPLRVEVNWNEALVDATVPVGPPVIDVSSGTAGGTWSAPVNAARIVFTDVPLAARAASQSSTAASVLGRTQPSPQMAASHTPWNTSGTQPPVVSACVTTP